MGVKTYDPKSVVVTIGGVPMSGFADGTFISFERDEDAFTKGAGADGEPYRVKSNNKMAALVLTLLETSNSNSALSVIMQLDEKSNNGVVPMIIKEIGAETIIFSGNCWVRKAPIVERAKEISNVEWTLDCSDSEVFIGGNAGVIV